MPAHLPFRRFREVALVAVGAAVGALVFGAVSLARTQADITVCTDGRGYLYQPPSGPCPTGSLTWNQQGPAGPQGPAGSQGPAGPQGAAGPAGSPSTTASALAAKSLKIVSAAAQIKNPKTYSDAYARAICPTGYRAIAGGAYTHSTAGPAPAPLLMSKPWWPGGIADEKKGVLPRGWSASANLPMSKQKGIHAGWVVATAVCVKVAEQKVAP
jgi:hypothetical protein